MILLNRGAEGQEAVMQSRAWSGMIAGCSALFDIHIPNAEALRPVRNLPDMKECKYRSILDFPPEYSSEVEKLFWSKVEKTDGCWLWKGAFNQKGYGIFNTGGNHFKAHRFSYELMKGRIPQGKQIDHLCRNRGCINPKHMEPVTNRENTLRGNNFIAINSRKTHCPKGHPLSVGNLRYRKKVGRECLICYEESRLNNPQYAKQWREAHPQYLREWRANAKLRWGMESLDRAGAPE